MVPPYGGHGHRSDAAQHAEQLHREATMIGEIHQMAPEGGEDLQPAIGCRGRETLLMDRS